MLCISDLLFSPGARTLQYEVSDVHTSAFGAETNEPGFSIVESNIEPLGALLRYGRHDRLPCTYTRS